MNIEEARHFILHHPEAELKANARHTRWLQAVEAVEAFRKAQAAELSRPGVLENPRYGRMRRTL